MLGVLSDQISGWYHTHKSSYGLPSTCNWKGYKTRSGHNSSLFACIMPVAYATNPCIHPYFSKPCIHL